MTKTVTISALRADSTPYAHHDVIVTLVAGSAGGVVGSNVIVSQTKVPLDADGEGSIVLATNDVEITSPSTSFYRFTVKDSTPTITRSVRITDDLPSTISWTRSGIEVGDPTIPQRDVSSDYVQVGDQSLTNYLADLEAGGGGGSSDAITVPDGTMTFVEAYYPPASDDLTNYLDSIDDAFVGAAQAIVAVGAASIGTSQKGAPNGVAELDGSGLVPSSQLPSYVDDVIVVADFAALPGTGADGKIYVTSDTNLSYRWTGSAYVEISKSLALGTTSSTAHRGDHGSTAYTHSQATGNPHGTTAGDLGAPTIAALADLSGVNFGSQVTARGNLGLGSLATKSAVARADITAGAIDVDLLDAALASTIAAATPNTRTITAGTGLTGGGTLAADRTLAIDAATLARIPAMVRAASDLTRTGTTKSTDPELTFAAAANTYYRVEFHLTISGDATADVSLGVTLPTGATMSLIMDYFATSIAATTGTQQGGHITTSGSGGTISAGVIASPGIAYRITGWVQIGSTAGDVSLIWGQVNNGAATGVTRHAGSHVAHYTP